MKLQATRVVLEDVTKRFGHTLAVDRVSLEIEPGEMVTFLGPSGCGKTTTLRIVAGLEVATDGRVFIGEADVTHLPPNARDVTMMFQSYALFPHLSVFENVAYGLRVLRRPEAEIRHGVQEVLELVGMPGMEGRSPSALSGGQQQRVALARSLVLHPKVLLFDEPLSNLDAKLRKRMRTAWRSESVRSGEDMGILCWVIQPRESSGIRHETLHVRYLTPDVMRKRSGFRFRWMRADHRPG